MADTKQRLTLPGNPSARVTKRLMDDIVPRLKDLGDEQLQIEWMLAYGVAVDMGETHSQAMAFAGKYVKLPAEIRPTLDID